MLQDLIQKSLLYFQHLEKTRVMEEMKLRVKKMEMMNLGQMGHYLGEQVRYPQMVDDRRWTKRIEKLIFLSLSQTITVS